VPEALPIQDVIRRAATKHGVPPELALAIAEQESSFNPTAIGPEITEGRAKGQRARGTFQILPSTWEAEQLGTNIDDPAENIEGGVKYLRKLLDQHQGDLGGVLATYGGVVTDTTYVPSVMGRIAKFRTGAAAGGAVRAPGTTPAGGSTGVPIAQPGAALPAAATRGMLPPSTMAGDAAPETAEPLSTRALRLIKERGPTGAVLSLAGGGFLPELGRAAVVEPLTGLATLAGTAYREGTVAAGKQMAGAILDPVKEHLALATTARQSRDPLAWAAHMVSAIPIYGPLFAGAGEALAEGQDPRAVAGRLIGGVVPIRGIPKPAKRAVAPAAQRAAEASMTKLLRSAADGSPGAERAIQKVLPLALDQSLMRLTKGRWQAAVAARQKRVGQQIGTVLEGELGSTVVPTAPVVEGLASLRDTVTNYVPVDKLGRPVGVAGPRTASDLKAVAYNQRLVRQADRLERIIREHGPTVMVRQLVNLRRDWDEFVYASKSWLNREDMIKQYEARAKASATDAIRGIIDQDPRLIDLSQLDKAYHLHRQLYDFIADEAFGRGHALPYYPGFGLRNALTRRMFNAAVKNPTWRIASTAVKARFARAMAGNNDSLVRALARQVLVGGVAAVGRGGEDDLLEGDEALVVRGAAAGAVGGR